MSFSFISPVIFDVFNLDTEMGSEEKIKEALFQPTLSEIQGHKGNFYVFVE